jgi:sigma-E factor negative regulatory protein RseA
VVIETAPVVTVSTDGRMNEYLLAHQGFSPSTAIQGLAPYIRSVSTTRTLDGRQ